MSFLPAVLREIARRQPNDPIRVTLEYMHPAHVGEANAVPLPTIVAHLQGRGINITETGFQQTVLAQSRGADFFIGSGRRGYFLIDTIDDALVMRDFYQARINREQQNLDNLRRQALAVGWQI
jgi:hypothetical protein